MAREDAPTGGERRMQFPHGEGSRIPGVSSIPSAIPLSHPETIAVRRWVFYTICCVKNSNIYLGILNPLDGMHHLRANDYSIPYREGVIIDRLVKEAKGSVCDVGLDKVSSNTTFGIC